MSNPDRMLAMATALVSVAYTHEYGSYHSATCKICGAVGHTKKHGGPPVVRGDVHHRGDCAVGVAHDVLEPLASPSGVLQQGETK